MFWKHLSYGIGLDYIAFTFTLYNVLYDWWLDPGQSRSQAVILRVWIFGGVTVTVIKKPSLLSFLKVWALNDSKESE